MLNKRLMSIYGIIFISATFAISSAGAMLADIISYRAMLQERLWVSDGPTENIQEWQRVKSQIKTSLALSPGNTEYKLALGRMASWRMFLADDGNDLSPILTLGYQSFRSALNARPYWGVGWSEFALFKSQIGELDPEFEFAVFSSIATGPFESRAIVNSMNATFSTWNELNPRMKEEAVFLFDMAFYLNYRTPIQLRDRAKELITFYDLLPEVCVYEELSSAAKEYCAESIPD